MSITELLTLFVASAGVGVLAALMGLGGGLFLVPLLTVLTDLPLRAAAGVSLVCTLATSAAGSIALDKARLADLGLIARLELAAAVGALFGAHVLVTLLPERAVAALFAAVVGLAGWRMLARRGGDGEVPAPDDGADDGEGDEAAPQPSGSLALGLLGFTASGALSAVLGIGGGPVKVPIQTEVLRVPLRVALANSNIMVGITAAAGAAVYYAGGQIPAAYVGPCALGIATGAYGGGLLAPRVRASRLRNGFVVILLIVAGRMAWRALVV